MTQGLKCDECGLTIFPDQDLSANHWRRVLVKAFAFFMENQVELDFHVCSKECAAKALHRFADLVLAEGDRPDFTAWVSGKMRPHVKYP